jgi:multicomponent Na+:H+ antiporter subunit F
MMRRIRWITGVAATFIFLGILLFVPFPSMISWQSSFLSRAFLWLLTCAILCLFRVVRGPTAPDRSVAIDMLGILIVGFCAVLSLATGRDWYVDIGIAWALQSFIGVMALAKYLEGRDFDE